jgi:hypothetical protein
MRGTPLPKKHVHIKTKHRKLRGPDWHISELMLDRTIDAIYRRLPVNRTYHVPYLAGYSTDCSQIYIDKDLPPSFINSDGERVDIDRYLLLHEAVEKSLIDTLGLRYQHAHQVALRAEQAAVRADGVSWNEYDNFMMKFVKEMGDEKVSHIPPDLDLKPYIDEHDTEILEQMRVLIKKAKARHKQTGSKPIKKAKKATRSAKKAKKSS